MISDIVQRLVTLGFGQREALVYLALLEGGGLTASEVYRRTGLKRTTVLAICEQLIQKGLATALRGRGKAKFFPQSPDRLLLLLDMQRREVDVRSTIAQEVLPELAALYRPQGDRPLVWSGEGDEGLRRARTLRMGCAGEAVCSTFLPAEFCVGAGEMTVCGDALILHAEEKQRYTVIIRSQAIADVCRAALFMAQKEVARMVK